MTVLVLKVSVHFTSPHVKNATRCSEVWPGSHHTLRVTYNKGIMNAESRVRLSFFPAVLDALFHGLLVRFGILTSLGSSREGCSSDICSGGRTNVHLGQSSPDSSMQTQERNLLRNDRS